MFRTTRTKPATRTETRIAGRTLIVRKIDVTTLTLYRSGGQWVEPANIREERHYQAAQLDSVTVETTTVKASGNAARDGKRGTVFHVTTTVRGFYADVCDYAGELVNLPSTVSFRDGSGIRMVAVLTPTHEQR